MPPPTSGNDTIIGGPGFDRLTGLPGDDYINAGYGDDFIFEGEFNWGGGLIDLFGPIPELVIGEPVNFGGGQDVLDGGNGFDELNFFGLLRPVYLNFETGRIFQNGERDQFLNIEYVVMGDVNDTVISGDNAFGILLQGGNDRVVNFIDISELDGGTGIDTVDARTMQSNITINALEGTTLIEGMYGGRIINFENYLGARDFTNTIIARNVDSRITGGLLADILEGGSGNDRLAGLAGNDTMRGRGGNDTMLGAAGNDIMNGGAGQNTMHGGAGNDRLINTGAQSLLTGGDGADTLISTANGTRLFGNAQNDTIESTGTDVTVSGGAGTDLITVEGNRATVSGDGGNDRINIFGVGAEVQGGSGNDQIFMWRGAAFGGDGDDRVTLSANYSGSLANLGTGDDVALVRGTANTIYAGDGADRLNITGEDHRAFGGAGNDIFNIGTRAGEGSQSGSTISGGAGNDTFFVFSAAASVAGNGGTDRFNIFTNEASISGLSGGGGADTFHFNEFGQDARVTITDFNLAQDRLGIRGVDALADMVSISTINGAAHLVFNQTSQSFALSTEVEITVVLEGLTAADITESILL